MQRLIIEVENVKDLDVFLPIIRRLDCKYEIERTDSIEERNKRLSLLFVKLKELGTFSEIKDPVEWQREIRKDKPFFGREE